LDTHVDFPVHGLDMQPYIINSNHGEAVYDLLAVSNHYGGMGGGHCKLSSNFLHNCFYVILFMSIYGICLSIIPRFMVLDTAYAKNKDDMKWYYFDDSSVTASSEDSVVVSNGKIKFI
jgi:ubiquitin carboxyl-terminal hydrolase 4/11/15